ncbi:HotDog domain-containing protein [Xylariales sp. PMI_506]|nr:HotDog domain-containing protein [Xylariales sp. PMI_506]
MKSMRQTGIAGSEPQGRSGAQQLRRQHLHAEELAHFRSIPWCAALLDKPGTRTVVPESRFAKESGEDNLFARTLNTSSTISNFLITYHEPPAVDGATAAGVSSPPPLVRELTALLTLRGGVDGYAGICHGGVVATIIDETVGLLIPLNRDRGALPAADYMTAYLNTTYLRPVRTPSSISVTVRINRVEGGRKYFCEALVQDGGGGAESPRGLTRAEILFVGVKDVGKI